MNIGDILAKKAGVTRYMAYTLPSAVLAYEKDYGTDS